jgi:hypothetical protein
MRRSLLSTPGGRFLPRRIPQCVGEHNRAHKVRCPLQYDTRDGWKDVNPFIRPQDRLESRSVGRWDVLNTS